MQDAVTRQGKQPLGSKSGIKVLPWTGGFWSSKPLSPGHLLVISRTESASETFQGFLRLPFVTDDRAKRV